MDTPYFDPSDYKNDGERFMLVQGTLNHKASTTIIGLLSSDRKNGQRYIDQANEDLEMAKMISTQLQGYYLSCFLSHQVAEKALGGLFLSHFGSFRGKLGHTNDKLDLQVLVRIEELLEFLGKYYR